MSDEKYNINEDEEIFAKEEDIKKTQQDVIDQINLLEERAKMILKAESEEKKRREEEERLEKVLDKVVREKKEEKKERKSAQQAQPRDHEARELQGREFADREMYMRRFYKNANMGKLFIDPDMIPADEVWYWAAKEVKGIDNTKHINNLFFNGWEIVRPHEAPELCRTNENAAELGMKSQSCIVTDASILLKRKKWIHQLQLDAWLQKQREVEQNTINLTNQMGDERIAATQVYENTTYYSPKPLD